MNNDDRNCIAGEILLMLETAVNGQEYVEFFFCAFEQGTVLDTGPTHLGNGLDLVA